MGALAPGAYRLTLRVTDNRGRVRQRTQALQLTSR